MREGYGKWLALLIHGGLDVTSAEDALSISLGRAATIWPESGVPDNPGAWIIVVARRAAIDMIRRTSRESPLTDAPDLISAEPMTMNAESFPIPDERIRLFYLCTHPAIDQSIQTPLMLQLILGFSAEAIAEFYCVSATQISQRLVRAKRKLRDAGIRPTIPSAESIPERSGAVLDALYALYGRGWERPTQSDRLSLSEEAIRLTTWVEQLTSLPEAKGLLAFMLFNEARRNSRRGSGGEFIPLEDQDITAWDRERIAQAERLLHESSQLRILGRYQLEAAIQSAHVSRRLSGNPSWRELCKLYDALVSNAPSRALALGRIAALAKAYGPERAWNELLDYGDMQYQPYWALRAHLAVEKGDLDEAQRSAERAQALSTEPAIVDYLTERFGARYNARSE